MTDTVVCVGAVVRQADSVLLVRQSAGHSLEGRWTIPWGQLEPGESPTAAVLREIYEEGGVSARIDGLLGLQELPEPWRGMIGIVFLCTHTDGEPSPDNQETDAARYLDVGQLDSIEDSIEPLSAWIVRRVLASDYKVLPMNNAGPFAPGPTYL